MKNGNDPSVVVDDFRITDHWLWYSEHETERFINRDEIADVMVEIV